jgi:hypothetical protein
MLKLNLNHILIPALLALMLAGVSCRQSATDGKDKESFSIPKTVLADKIKGGWAGQTIGVVYGAPVDSSIRVLSSTLADHPWNRHYVKYWWDKKHRSFR